MCRLTRPAIGNDRAHLLWPIAFPENEAAIEILQIALAQFRHGHRLTIKVTVLGGIAASRHAPQQILGFPPCSFGSPDSVQPDRITAGAARRPILDYVAPLAGGKDTQPKAGQTIIPDDIVYLLALGRIDGSFRKLSQPQLPFWQHLA